MLDRWLQVTTKNSYFAAELRTALVLRTKTRRPLVSVSHGVEKFIYSYESSHVSRTARRLPEQVKENHLGLMTRQTAIPVNLT